MLSMYVAWALELSWENGVSGGNTSTMNLSTPAILITASIQMIEMAM